MLVGSMGGGALWYYKDTQSTIATLRDNNSKLMMVAETNQETINSMARDYQLAQENMLVLQERAKEAEVTNFINQSDFFKDKNLEIFNFNYKLSTWLILNNFKNFSLIPSSFLTPKKNETLENELISSLNFLNFYANWSLFTYF